MKKIHLFFIVLFIGSFQVFSQKNINSVLNSENYYKYPRQYLSQLDTSKMQTNILIDRVITDVNLLAYDGVITTTCGLGTWKKMYRSIKLAAIDTSIFLYSDFIEELAISYNQSQKVNLIGLIDITFDKISDDAIGNGNFQEIDTLLFDNTSSVDSYTQHRMLSSCVLGSSNIWGDDIKFVLPEFLKFRNNRNEEVIDIEIDLGNGSGFQSFDFDDTITGNYGSNSQWEEVILKIRKRDLITLEEFDLYSHFTFQRTGTSTVPDPDNDFLYPLGSYLSHYEYDEEYSDCMESCWGYPPNEQYDCEFDCNHDYRHYFEGTARLKVSILFADGNDSEKLRKPLILSDAFDPGNKRHYAFMNYDYDAWYPRNNDGRGLFQILNGDPSPWYDGNGSLNLINQLKAMGYDIIFVDYISGAGDIPTNAGHLKGLLNNVINDDLYRDNETEEIVLIGPSMGGLITRYTLAEMEFEGVEHYVKTWISFDAPQKGAYISIGLQHCLNYMKDIPSGSFKEPAKKGLKKLNSVAAKQMLLMHYDRSNGLPDFYNEIENIGDNNGYPMFSKNYAISNGGKSKLYEGNHNVIIDYRLGILNIVELAGWATRNAYGNTGKEDVFKGVFNAIPNLKREFRNISFDNAPGGWLAPLYSINTAKYNYRVWDEDDIQYMKTCFMPTMTTFGIAVTEENIFITHDNVNVENTPFDVIHGMETNEEHVRISNSTGDFLKSELQDDLETTARPRNRENEALNETVSGKLAYNVTNDIIFAGNDNTFVFKNTADINIKSENTIHFLPGFKIEEGAKVSAKIISTNKSNLAIFNNANHAINYFKPSPFVGNITDYKIYYKSSNSFSSTNIKIYPNPSQGIYLIELNDLADIETILRVYNSFGILVKEENIGKQKRYSLNLSTFTNGIYHIIIERNQHAEIRKLIKI